MSSQPLALTVLKLPAYLAGLTIKTYFALTLEPLNYLFKNSFLFLEHPSFTAKSSQMFYLKFGLLRGLLSTILSLVLSMFITMPVILYYSLNQKNILQINQSNIISLLITLTVSAFKIKKVKEIGLRVGNSSLFRVYEYSTHLVFDLLSILLTLFVVITYYKIKNLRRYWEQVDGMERTYFKFVCQLCFEIVLDFIKLSAICVIYLLRTRIRHYKRLLIKEGKSPLEKTAITYVLASFTIGDWLFLVTYFLLSLPLVILTSNPKIFLLYKQINYKTSTTQRLNVIYILIIFNFWIFVTVVGLLPSFSVIINQRKRFLVIIKECYSFDKRDGYEFIKIIPKIVYEKQFRAVLLHLDRRLMFLIGSMFPFQCISACCIHSYKLGVDPEASSKLYQVYIQFYNLFFVSNSIILTEKNQKNEEIDMRKYKKCFDYCILNQAKLLLMTVLAPITTYQIICLFFKSKYLQPREYINQFNKEILGRIQTPAFFELPMLINLPFWVALSTFLSYDNFVFAYQLIRVDKRGIRMHNRRGLQVEGQFFVIKDEISTRLRSRFFYKNLYFFTVSVTVQINLFLFYLLLLPLYLTNIRLFLLMRKFRQDKWQDEGRVFTVMFKANYIFLRRIIPNLRYYFNKLTSCSFKQKQTQTTSSSINRMNSLDLAIQEIFENHQKIKDSQLESDYFEYNTKNNNFNKISTQIAQFCSIKFMDSIIGKIFNGIRDPSVYDEDTEQEQEQGNEDQQNNSSGVGEVQSEALLLNINPFPKKIEELQLKADKCIEEQLYEEYLEIKMEIYHRDYEILKGIISILVLRAGSISLLWRFFTFNRYFTNDFIFKNRDNNLKMIFFELYCLCLKKMIKDLYLWPFYLFLLASPTYRKSFLEEYNKVDRASPGSLEEVKEDIKLMEGFFFKFYNYSLNTNISRILFSIKLVAPWRAFMISKMQEFTFNNAASDRSRRVLKLITATIIRDLQLFLYIFTSLIINPLRLFSFLLGWIDGSYFEELNDFGLDMRCTTRDVLNQANSTRGKMLVDIKKCVKFDLMCYTQLTVCLICPTKWLLVVGILKDQLLMVVEKYQQRKQTGVRMGGTFLPKMAEARFEICRQIKEQCFLDLDCYLDSLIILTRACKIRQSFSRIWVILRFRIRSSFYYQSLLRLKNLLKFDSKKNNGEKNLNEKAVILEGIGLLNLRCLGQYLTIKEKMTLCTVNRSSRDYHLKTSAIWVAYYQKNINDYKEIEISTLQTIPWRCITHYRMELAKIRDTERDFRIGIRKILKEEAFRSMLSYSETLSLPYKAIDTVTRHFKIPVVSQKTYVIQQNRVYDLERGRQFIKVNANIVNNSLIQLKENEGDYGPVRGFIQFTTFLLKFFYRIYYYFYKIRSYFVREIFTHNNLPLIEVLKYIVYWLIQALFSVAVIYVARVYLRFLMNQLGFDFFHALLGPLFVHPFAVGSIILNIEVERELYVYQIDYLAIFKLLYLLGGYLKKMVVSPWVSIVLWVIRAIKKVIFSIEDTLSGLQKGIVRAMLWIGRLHDMTLGYPTRHLVNKGIFLEIIHLFFCLFWISWPVYYLLEITSSNKWILIVGIVCFNLFRAVKIVEREGKARYSQVQF